MHGHQQGLPGTLQERWSWEAFTQLLISDQMCDITQGPLLTEILDRAPPPPPPLPVRGNRHLKSI